MTIKIKATLPEEKEVNNGKIFDYIPRHAWTLAVIEKGQIETIAKLITYRTSSGKSNYASIWVFGGRGEKRCYLSGHGQAGGYGYHRISAATSAAISSAGIKLDKHISGVGEEAMEQALIAIGRALGYRKPVVIQSL